MIRKPRGRIALDADGVLVDYHEGFAQAWERAFGERPKIRDPEGYHPLHYWDATLTDPETRTHFKRHFYAPETWSSFPALPGAVEACARLREANYELVCVSALNPELQPARESNLRNLGFGLRRVFTTGSLLVGNPKRRMLMALHPLAVVDDYLPYLQGLPEETWKALVQGRPSHNPNNTPSLELPNSRHKDLASFTTWWLADKRTPLPPPPNEA